MFCRLHQAKIATSIDLSDFETCVSECEYFKNSTCSVSEDKSVFLTKEKFGWRLNLKISLDEPIPSKSENTYYCSLIQLIHPSYDDVWVSKSLMKDKETDIFLIFYDGKRMDDVENMVELNKLLKSKYHYNGRAFDHDDFIMGEKDV